jgi:hypothetical protein
LAFGQVDGKNEDKDCTNKENNISRKSYNEIPTLFSKSKLSLFFQN